MKSFSVAVEINAGPERVWTVLTDLHRWTTWNTTVEKVEGTMALGKRITVYATIAKGRGFPVTVAEYAAPSKMTWVGGMPFGLFVGRRTFELAKITADSTDFRMSETFTGLLEPLMSRALPDLQPAFDEFAQCLKREAETQSG